MASVYILYSPSIDKFYIGSCNDFSNRLKQHNQAYFSSSYTAKTQDWQLFFFQEELEYQQARQIENHIKKMKSRRYLENLVKYPEIMEKLRKRFAGSSR